MKKVLLIMAAALMTMTQCRKQETVPATPSANTIKMTITAGPGAKTEITNEGAITWTLGDKLYVSDGTNWLGSLDLQSGVGEARGTFTGTIQGIGEGTTKCHFFYLGHDNGMAAPTGTTNAVISFASQDGSKDDALKYHLGHGSADVKVSGGEATGEVTTMITEIAIAHLKLKMDDADYKGKVTMDVSNTMTVNPNGTFTGGGKGITIAAGTSGDRYVTLIPTEATNVSFSGSATGSMTFGHGIQANNLYGMAFGIEVTLNKVPVTGVSLDKTKLSLEEGETETLVATVTPDNATYKDVTWSSDDESVATVDQNGVVTAVGAGTATITVTTVDGGKTATCTVTVTAAHEYVDLGLPSGLLWATCNVGADSPEDYGDYYQWGGVTSVTSTDINVGWAGCPFTNGTYSSGNKKVFTKYVPTGKTEYWAGSGDPDNKLVLESSDDAATQAWGGDWRMPTTGDWDELYKNTNCTWTTENGVYGRKFTSKTDSSKYIFLPAAGIRNGTNAYNAGSNGDYWSSSLNSSNPSYAYFMDFNSGSVNPQYNSNRCYGFTVRPVRAAR